MKAPRKFINDPLQCANQLLDGLVEAYDGQARKVGERSIVMNDLSSGRAALLVGAAATIAAGLDDLERLVTKARDHTRSIGVSTLAGSIPATGEPTFQLEPGKIGLGMGIHGEKGVANIPFCTADELAPKLLDL